MQLAEDACHTGSGRFYGVYLVKQAIQAGSASPSSISYTVWHAQPLHPGLCQHSAALRSSQKELRWCPIPCLQFWAIWSATWGLPFKCSNSRVSRQRAAFSTTTCCPIVATPNCLVRFSTRIPHLSFACPSASASLCRTAQQQLMSHLQTYSALLLSVTFQAFAAPCFCGAGLIQSIAKLLPSSSCALSHVVLLLDSLPLRHLQPGGQLHQLCKGKAASAWDRTSEQLHLTVLRYAVSTFMFTSSAGAFNHKAACCLLIFVVLAQKIIHPLEEWS